MDLIDVAIKPEHLDLVEKSIQGKNPETNPFQYMLECLLIDPEHYLQWNWRKKPYGPVQKHYDDEPLAAWLKQYCASGIIAYWNQEEEGGGGWAYEFDGEGGVSMCSTRRAAAIKGWSARKNPEREIVRIDREIESRRAAHEELTKSFAE